jgi:hypothetical protein
VLAAAKLACLAISSRRPEQFIWIDEDGVAGQVGSSSGPETPPVHRPLWILASAGWATLHPRAQALVADVLLMLNLAGRGNGTAERMERLRRADRNDLPPCLTRARDQLAVSETVGSATVGKPGANCIDDCPYRLCPYPPVGQQSYHAEISEGLCRKLAADPVWFVPWQKHLSHKELKRFWTAMAERGRPRHGSPDEQ